MYRFTCCLILGLITGLITSTADAGMVLMIGPNPSGLFSNGGLTQYGHTVTIGPNYNAFDGTFDLSSYDVIVLSAVVYNLDDMPTLGQQSIVDFVADGGGLITGEWVTWRHQATGAFGLIDPILPATTDGSYIGGAGVDISVRYQEVTSDPILNAGLPSTMDFGAVSEIITPRPGATVFYSGDSISPYRVVDSQTNQWVEVHGVFPSAGLVGWNYGLGRVLSFSTTLEQPVGPGYTDNYSRLVANAIDWAGAGSPAQVPEPGSLTLLVLGGISVIGRASASPEFMLSES